MFGAKGAMHCKNVACKTWCKGVKHGPRGERHGLRGARI